MTVTSENKRNQYTITAAQVIFPYTFRILAKEHLLVVHTTAVGVETELEITTNYTVSGVGGVGGNVTTCGDDSPYPTGDTLTIIRDVPLTQLIDYVENDMFPAETHEKGLDKLTMLIQQFSELHDRMLLLSVVSTYSELDLPDPVSGQYLRWKTDLSGLENVAAGPSGQVPSCYVKMMIANETFTYSGNNHPRCFLDPGGANRNFDPSGELPGGFKIEIVNTGGEIITFDSIGIAQNVGPGQRGVFLFDGTVWY